MSSSLSTGKMKGRSHQHARHARRAEIIEQELEVREANPVPEQIVSVVYVTASPTFTGAIAGYSTLGQTDSTTSAQKQHTTTSQTQAAKNTQTSESSSKNQDATVSSHTTLQTSASSSSDLPSSLIPTTSVASSVALLAATGSVTSSTNSQSISATTSAASASSTADSSSSSSSGGMSTGGKAGLAIGILLLAAAVLSLVLFCFKKKKAAAKQDRLEDEKADAFGAQAQRAASTQSARTVSTAPRLSLRPVTQFQPYNSGAEKQAATSAQPQMSTLAPIASVSSAARSERPVTTLPVAGQEQNKDNPFGNHAEAIDTPNTDGPAVLDSPAAEKIFAASAAAAAAAAVATSSAASSRAPSVEPTPLQPAGLKRGASKRENGPRQIDFTTNGGAVKGPPSPTASEFSNASGSTTAPAQTATGMAIAAAGGPPNSAVHRVQLDFTPSMEDELELRAGDLIRVLHEYDDGWALCIRLDRSQQGVVPRTCLSTRPVKPRPQQNGPRGPPPGMRIVTQQQQRPMSPGMNQGPRMPNNQGPPYPSSPSGNKPMTPIGPNGQGMPRGPGMKQGPPRSMSPAGNRPMNQGPPQQGPMTPQGQRPPQGFPGPQRPMTPQGQRPQGPPQQRPMTPQGQRPTNPQGPPQQRPMTPQGQPIQTPVSAGQRSRSGSVAQPQPRPSSPPGPPPMNPAPQMDGPSSPPNIRSPVERKPVPGQAL
ncbi:SH3 domain protein [Rutstroemia sp. NJR-2017a BVV2]|nr:SH3 domain protein [Rutstroemia sp. NJR-2017a BVV2]